MKFEQREKLQRLKEEGESPSKRGKDTDSKRGYTDRSVSSKTTESQRRRNLQSPNIWKQSKNVGNEKIDENTKSRRE